MHRCTTLLRLFAVAAFCGCVTAAPAAWPAAQREDVARPGNEAEDSEHCRRMMMSTKYDPACMDRPERMWPMLITGAARSGTTFMASVLNRLNIRTSHEEAWHDPLTHQALDEPVPLRDGAVSWVLAFSDTHYPHWAGDLRQGRFQHVFHQVRHPLEVLGSLAATFHPHGSTVEYISRHIPLPGPFTEPTYDEKLLFSLHFWVHWTKFVEEIADWTFKVEEVNLRDICLKAGLLSCPSEEEGRVMKESLSVLRTGRRENYYPITWEILFDVDPTMAATAKTMACNSFGYDCDVQVDVAAARGSLNNFHAYTIGMCTRVKNEGHYLGEWIDFHRLAGVSKFYIWYDESDDNTLQVLTNYQKMTSNVRVFNITTLPGHEAGQQPFAHAEHSFRDACLRDNPDRVRWMAFIDADEFMFPALRLNLAEHLDESCSTDVSHIAVRNRFFGSSGRASKPQGKLLIESFKQFNSFVTSKDGSRRVVHKMLANTGCVEAMATHYPTVVKNTSNCRVIYNLGASLGHAGADAEDAFATQQHNMCAKKLRLNHYVTKSREEFLEKYRKGKLSQAAKEAKLGIDRPAFVAMYGPSFLLGGVEEMKKEFRARNGGRSPVQTSTDPMEKSFLRFVQEFATKDGNRSSDDNILKYAGYLRSGHENDLNGHNFLLRKPLTGM